VLTRGRVVNSEYLWFRIPKCYASMRHLLIAAAVYHFNWVCSVYLKTRLLSLFTRTLNLCFKFNALSIDVLDTVKVRLTFVWDMTPCSFINLYKRFEGICCFIRLNGMRAMTCLSNVGMLARTTEWPILFHIKLPGPLLTKYS
jgi:hypothetical protein